MAATNSKPATLAEDLQKLRECEEEIGEFHISFEHLYGLFHGIFEVGDVNIQRLAGAGMFISKLRMDSAGDCSIKLGEVMEEIEKLENINHALPDGHELSAEGGAA